MTSLRAKITLVLCLLTTTVAGSTTAWWWYAMDPVQPQGARHTDLQALEQHMHRLGLQVVDRDGKPLLGSPDKHARPEASLWASQALALPQAERAAAPTAAWLIGGWIVFLLLCCAASIWLLDLWVVQRLRRLSNELHRINNEHLWDSTLNVQGHDEVAEIAQQTNALLDQVSLQFENLESIADTDALTGLANRRSFDETLTRAVALYARYGRPFSLVVIDVDHFKHFNDHYGHAEGDLALQAVANCLNQEARRPGDLPARVGGEEFAVVLEDTPASGAIHWVGRVQQHLAQLMIPHAMNSVGPYLTLSAGVATARDGDTPDSLFKRADSALYQAKREGRNRMVMGDTAP